MISCVECAFPLWCASVFIDGPLAFKRVESFGVSARSSPPCGVSSAALSSSWSCEAISVFVSHHLIGRNSSWWASFVLCAVLWCSCGVDSVFCCGVASIFIF